MKKVMLALLLLAPSLACAEKTPPNPADYTINVHVNSSRLVYIGSGISNTQVLEDLMVLINGKTYELTNAARLNSVLRLGDYQAKTVTVKGQTQKSYEDGTVYQFLLPDGSTRNFYVAGEFE
jgi:hypothetical protein